MSRRGLSAAQIRALLERLAKVDLDSATGKFGEDLAGLARQGARSYVTATDPLVSNVQDLIYKYLPSKSGGISSTGAQLAGNRMFKGALRSLPAIGAVGGVMGAADILAGPKSIGNKGIDLGAATIGAILGAPGGKLGMIAGAGGGKMVSDALQQLFGGQPRTEKQVKLEEALALLKAGAV